MTKSVQTKKETRGGKRSGSGRKRKPKDISDIVKARLMAAALRMKAKHGIPVEEALLEIIYDSEEKGSTKVAAFKAYSEALLVKESEQKVDIIKQEFAPRTYIPKRQEDPALKLIKNE